MSSKTLVIVGISFALTHCGFVSDTPPSKKKTTTTTTPTGSDDVSKPIVDALAATTCALKVALKGRVGKPASGLSVIVVGGDNGTGLSADVNPTTGTFCMAVNLKAKQLNTFEVRTHDSNLGEDSKPITVTTTQSACKDDVGGSTTEEEDSQNIALGLTAKASQKSDQGNESFLTDGLYVNSVVYSGGYGTASYDGWVTIDLGKLYLLDKIVVGWRDSKGSGSSYGMKYRVLISQQSDPGDPSLTNGYWTEVYTYTAGDGGSDSIDLSSTKPTAQHVALWLELDGDGSVTNFKDYFALTEFEVWDSPQTTKLPTNTSNLCSSGS